MRGLLRAIRPYEPHRFVDYTRVSDKKQNRLSPKQQSDEIIHRVIKNMGLPWEYLATDRHRLTRWIRRRLEAAVSRWAAGCSRLVAEANFSKKSWRTFQNL